MNVLRVIATMDPVTGGPCQGIRNSIAELKKLGIRNEVVCLDDPEAEFLLKDSLSIHALEKGKGPWWYSAKLIPWLLKNFHRFDAIVIHGLWLYPSFAVNRAIHKFKIQQEKNQHSTHLVPKLFIMPHGMMDPYFQNDPGRKLKAIRNWIYWKLIEHKVISGADALLFTCEEELRLARKPFRPYCPRRELTIGYGLKSPPTEVNSMSQAFLKMCPGTKDQHFILFLSRIHEKKGVDLLISAYAGLLTSGSAPTINGAIPKLVIAGPGLDTSYGKKIKALVSQSKILQDHVYFPGMLTGSAKWGAFYASDAFILPSHQENFGIAVAESLACGTPVLISDKVNIWKEISTSKAGLVAPDTLDGTCSLIKGFISLAPGEREIMGRQARSTFEKHFDIRCVAKNFAEALEN